MEIEGVVDRPTEVTPGDEHLKAIMNALGVIPRGEWLQVHLPPVEEELAVVVARRLRTRGYKVVTKRSSDGGKRLWVQSLGGA